MLALPTVISKKWCEFSIDGDPSTFA